MGADQLLAEIRSSFRAFDPAPQVSGALGHRIWNDNACACEEGVAEDTYCRILHKCSNFSYGIWFDASRTHHSW
jgi:CXCXC repeat